MPDILTNEVVDSYAKWNFQWSQKLNPQTWTEHSFNPSNKLNMHNVACEKSLTTDKMLNATNLVRQIKVIELVNLQCFHGTWQETYF